MSENENKARLMEIGGRVKLEREKMGLTQEQFADKFGYPRSTVGKLEAGLRDFKSTEILTLAEQLGVSCDYLLGRTMVTAPDSFIQEAVTRLGLSEQALRFLELLNTSFDFDNDFANNFDSNKFDKESTLAMINDIFSTSINPTAWETYSMKIYATYGVQIFTTMWNYCYQEYSDIEMEMKTGESFTQIITADAQRNFQIYKLNRLLDDLRNELRGKEK